MANLKLKRVKYQNFLSVGNKAIEIDLLYPLTIITGNNGAGKTAGVIDAVYFALFGKSIRKTNKPLLVNNINKKGLRVELDFEANGIEYKVVRGISPNIFEIYKEGNLINQDARVYDYQDELEKIIGVGEETIKQIVFLNSTNYKPFSKCTAAEKKKIIDDLFGLSIVSRYYDEAKRKYIDIRNEIDKIEMKMNILIDQKRKIENMLNSGTSSEEEYRGMIEEAKQKLHELDMKIEQKRIDMLNVKFDKDKLLEIEKIMHGLEVKRKEMQNKIEIFKNDKCPTCERPFSTADTKILNKLQEKLKEIEKAIDEARNIKNNMKNEEKRLKEIEKEIRVLEAKKHSVEKEIVKIQAKIENSKKMHDKMKEKIMNEKIVLEKEIEENERKINDLKEKYQYLEVLRNVLDDNIIKRFVLQKYIPIFEKFVKEFLAIMEFPYSIKIDDDLSITCLLGSKEIPYWNLSEGQRLRVDLAFMMALRKIAQIRSSFICNYLVLDEIGSSSLDEEGLMNFIQLLNKLAMQENLNVFLITHNSDIVNYVENARILEFVKSTFTEMREHTVA